MASASRRNRSSSSGDAEPGGQGLEGDHPAEGGLPRLVDDAHAAAAQLPEELVAGKARPAHGRFGASPAGRRRHERSARPEPVPQLVGVLGEAAAVLLGRRRGLPAGGAGRTRRRSGPAARSGRAPGRGSAPGSARPGPPRRCAAGSPGRRGPARTAAGCGRVAASAGSSRCPAAPARARRPRSAEWPRRTPPRFRRRRRELIAHRVGSGVTATRGRLGERSECVRGSAT